MSWLRFVVGIATADKSRDDLVNSSEFALLATHALIQSTFIGKTTLSGELLRVLSRLLAEAVFATPIPILGNRSEPQKSKMRMQITLSAFVAVDSFASHRN